MDEDLRTPDQADDAAGARRPRSATGATRADAPDVEAQQGKTLTTALGTPLPDTDRSLTAGPRGPVLLQDHHLREKITHFDHERIPERVVHARGAAAHGRFESYGTAGELTVADFLAPGRVTPVFTRFSPVVGSRGSSDTVRDTRGFATKFHTSEGVFDLVGNNIPVFFIQDAIKFPDVVHAAKPHPDREIPQAQSAHDTFWDFVSLHTEAQHHTMWQMSDRGIPSSYRMMEGFGIHTFRLTNGEGVSSLVKFHWKPALGAHSLTWEEAQLLGGVDPDFHRRDLADAIEAGALPQWELGVQVFPDTDDQSFEGIDLLDPTKLVPEELAPVRPLGLMTLDRNVSNFFAETEQVAFHPGHLPPGIDVTDDPLLQGRLFSYLDTQLTRLGGPNFDQLPINRPHAPVNDMLRDGYGQQATHEGIAPYKPNSLGGGCPFAADPGEAVRDIPVPIASSVRERRTPRSFEDHFSQARLFWLSMTSVEQDHIAAAYSFELGKCTDVGVRERQLECLARIDEGLCATVAEALGLPVPDPAEPPATDLDPSPALSQLGRRWPVDGRRIGVVVDPERLPDDLGATLELIESLSMTPLLIAPEGGEILGRQIDRTFATARSVEFDALAFVGSPAAAADATPALDAKAGAGVISGLDPRAVLLAHEAWRHSKALAAWGAGSQVIDALVVAGRAAEIDPSGAGEGPSAGVIVGADGEALVRKLQEFLGTHRVWQRFAPSLTP
ncbi:catalase HPII [Brachybacterium endophyticum]|uniref:Catalase n=1 Tax=Brachybacterium endophyticum TaxID=2182385 RepID=A0A2U2RKM3_9MICO|nr:catalase [Brachybacterium endophyticum]PWH06429.1 catalase HPII [Brachybacterium endophyticum]